MGTGKRHTFPLALFPALALIIGVGILYAVPGRPLLSAEKLTDRLGLPLLRLLCYLGIGLIVGQAIETMGWTSKLAAWVRPMMRWGHLKDESGATFTAAFVSGTVANTMLMTFHQEGKLSRRELVFTYLVNSGLPVYFLHLPTTFFVLVSLTRQAGLIYLCLTLLAALIRNLGVLTLTRIQLPSPSSFRSAEPSYPQQEKKALGSEVWKKFRKRFYRVVLFTVPIYVLVFLVNEMGLFGWLRQVTARLISVGFFPVEAASVVVFSVAAEFTSGMAAAGALLDAGALSVPQTVVALILGSIAATPIRAVRHQLPSHAGIFSPSLGTKMLLISQGIRIVSLIVVTIPYMLSAAWA